MTNSIKSSREKLAHILSKPIIALRTQIINLRYKYELSPEHLRKEAKKYYKLINGIANIIENIKKADLFFDPDSDETKLRQNNQFNALMHYFIELEEYRVDKLFIEAMRIKKEFNEFWEEQLRSGELNKEMLNQILQLINNLLSEAQSCQQLIQSLELVRRIYAVIEDYIQHIDRYVEITLPSGETLKIDQIKILEAVMNELLPAMVNQEITTDHFYEEFSRVFLKTLCQYYPVIINLSEEEQNNIIERQLNRDEIMDQLYLFILFGDVKQANIEELNQKEKDARKGSVEANKKKVTSRVTKKLLNQHLSKLSEDALPDGTENSENEFSSTSLINESLHQLPADTPPLSQKNPEDIHINSAIKSAPPDNKDDDDDDLGGHFSSRP